MYSPTVLEVLATLALFAGPTVTYIIARRQERQGSLMADIEAVRGWAEERRQLESDIRDYRERVRMLEDENAQERQKRRDADARADEQQARLEKIEELLRDCLGVTLSDE